MPYVDNNGVRIHYHTEGDGPPLVLMHTLFGSIEDWREYGYVENLKNDFSLILLDGRGHGAIEPTLGALIKDADDIERFRQETIDEILSKIS